MGLVSHAEDADDHNLPLMYWYAAESLVPDRIDDAIAVYKVSKVPRVRTYLVRRLSQTGDSAILAKIIQTAFGEAKSAGEQQAVAA